MLIYMSTFVLHAARKTEPIKGMRYDHVRLVSDDSGAALLVANGKDLADVSDEAIREKAVALLRPTLGDDGLPAAEFSALATSETLKGKNFRNITALGGKQPVFAFKGAEDQTKVALLPDLAGAQPVSSSVLKDAAGNEIDHGVVLLTSSDDTIFALVPGQDHTFSSVQGTNRGVALLKYGVRDSESDDDEGGELELFQFNAGNVKDTDAENAIAASIATNTDPGVVAFSSAPDEKRIEQAYIGAAGNVWWDKTLERLYIGLSDVTRDNSEKEGGVLSLLLGYFDNNANGGDAAAFKIKSVVHSPKKEMFYKKTGYAQDQAAAVDLGFRMLEIAQQAFDRNVAAKKEGAVKAAFDKDGADHGAGANPALGEALAQAKEGLAKTDRIDELMRTIAHPGVGFAGGRGGSSTANAQNNLDRAKDLFTGAGDFVKTSRENAHKAATLHEDAVAAGNDEYVNGLQNIFGYYFDGITPFASSHGIQQALYSGNNNVMVSSRKLQTMHTSTGKMYLILNSVIGIQPVGFGGSLFVDAEDWLYALPLITHEINSNPATKGSIARVDKDGVPELVTVRGEKLFQLPETFDHMPRATQPAVRVGGSNPVPGSWVEDLFVKGDSVYMFLAGPNNAQRGVYKSTALFNKDGFIMAWTQAERVMGVVTKMEAGGLDLETGNFYALSGDGNVGRISSWGRGDVKMRGGEEKLLATVLERLFPADQGGVHHYIQFDRFTPGFVKGAFAMSVAVGKDKIALVETGEMGSEGFEPTQEFIEGKTVKVISTPELLAIAPLTSAVMTIEGVDAVMIVGGFGGMVKLTFAGALSKIEGLADPASVRFPNAAFTTPVYLLKRGKFGRDDRVHVLNERGFEVYQVGAGGPFDQLNVSNPVDLISLARPNDSDNSSAIIASSSGLHTSFDLTGLTGVARAPREIIHLLYLSENNDNRPSVPGNLYVLARDKRFEFDEETETEKASSSELAYQVYRYAVTHKTGPDRLLVEPIDADKAGNPIPYVQFDDERNGVTVDGSLLFNQLPKDTTVDDFLRVVPMRVRGGSNLDSMREDERTLVQELAIDAGLHGNISVMSRDPSSGAWVVPGDWGIRVNE